MPRYGEYETGRELQRSGLSVVAAAHRAGATGPDGQVVKLCRAPEEILGAAGARRAVEAFLARAKVQKEAAGAGGHWAPILEAAPCPEGAYYVTTLYPRTAQRLITGRVKLDAAALRAIATGIIDGLEELRRACGRAHGAIKASNVLIAGSGAEPLVEVVLADPAPAGTVAPTTAEDLRALGEVIHQLVLHQPTMTRGGWPVPLTPAWTRLGATGGKWLEFCNSLLDPALGGRSPTLTGVRGEIPPAGARGGGRTRVWAGLGAVALLAAVGGGVLLSRRAAPPPLPPVTVDQSVWERLSVQYDEWFAALLSEALNTNNAAVFGGDSYLKDLVGYLGDMRALRFETVAGPGLSAKRLRDDPAQGPDSEAALRRAADAEQRVQKVRGLLSKPEISKWRAWNNADRAVEVCRTRGWTRPEQYLRSIVDGVGPNEHLLDAVRALQGAAPLVEDLSKLDRAFEVIANTTDPVLQALTADVARSLTADQLADDPSAIRGAVGAVRGELADIAVFLTSDEWKVRTDVELFEKENKAQAQLREGAPPRAAARSWLEEVRKDEFKLPAGADPRASESWAALDDVKGAIAKLESGPEAMPEQARALQAGLDAIRARIAERAGRRWTVANAGWIQDQGKLIDDDARKLAISARGAVATAAMALPDLKKRLGEMQEIVADSASINERWRRQRDALLARTDWTTMSLSAARDEVVTCLRDIRAAFPERPDFRTSARAWNGGLIGAAEGERERLIASILGALQWPARGVPQTSARLSEAVDAYSAWTGSVGAIAADMGEVEDRLDALYALSTPLDGRSVDQIVGGWEGRLPKDSEAVKAALVPVTARVESLRAIEAESAATALLQKAGGFRPEERMAAWRRLGPAFSALPDINLLEAEVRLQKSLRAGCAAAGQALQRRAAGHGETGAGAQAAGERRAGELRSELIAQGQARWASFMLNAAKPGDVRAGAATGRRELSDASVSAADRVDLVGDEQRLDPRIRLNLALADLEDARDRADRARTEGADAKQVAEGLKESIRQFRTTVGGLALPASEPLSKLTAELDTLVGAPGAKARDPAEMGPGDPGAAARWQGRAENDSIVFSSPSGVKMTFVMVQPDGGDVAYVSADEVSVGQVLAVLATPEQWRLVQAHLPATESTDNRNGPRSWQWLPGGAGIVPPPNWIGGTTLINPVFGATPDSGQISGYSGQIADPGAPSLESPMNWVTPETAAYVAHQIGCRLPTAAEWAGAVRVEMAAARQSGDAGAYVAYLTGADPKPNLRDQTWDEQLRYMLAEEKKKQVFAQARTAWPFADSYSYSTRDPKARDVGRAYAFDDQTLWLWDVGKGPGARFHNLVGNVAEIVFDAPERLTSLAREATPDDVLKALADGAREKKLSVIGGSALSPRDEDPTRPTEFRVRNAVHPDVGFRMAYSAADAMPTGQAIIAKLGQLLTPAPYQRSTGPGGG